MSKKTLLSLLTILAFGLAALLAAQENPSPQGEHQGQPGMGGPPPVLGTITSVGVDRFEIKKPDGTSQTVMVNDQTHFRQRSAQQGQQPQELQLEDLKVGDHVAVRGAPNGDKQVTAMGVMRLTEEQFQRFQSGGGPGGGLGGGWGVRAGSGMESTRAGGEIESINGNQIKVNGRRGERVIVVNDQTTFGKEGQTITLKDLKVGDRIFAMGKNVDGMFVATEVRSGRPGGGRGGWQGQQGQQGPQN
jgi:hypothetical protein